jgi:hypothetical protein
MSDDSKSGIMRFIAVVLPKAEQAKYHRYIEQCKKALKETKEIIEKNMSGSTSQ